MDTNPERPLYFEEIVGQSPALLHMIEKVNRVAATDASVLSLVRPAPARKSSLERSWHETDD
jgi:sigma54-dependent transcription regulator